MQGDRWTDKTARLIFPVLIWCAKNGRTVIYDQLNRWIVDNDLGYSVLQPKYGWPAGAEVDRDGLSDIGSLHTTLFDSPI